MDLQLTSKAGLVVTAYASAGDAGLAILRQGGNAIDAAVAAAMACCVIVPNNVGLGGYGGTMVGRHAKSNRTFALDFDSRAPLAFTPELYKNPAASKHGYLAAGVPGVLAGLSLALQRFGSKSWHDCAAPAIALAEDGIEVNSQLAAELAGWYKSADGDSRAAIFPDGKLPATGDRWRQPDLARTFRTIDADPRSFYTGEIARAIVRAVRAHGGILSEEDFTRFQAQVVDPLTVKYRGVELVTPPPPAGGITTLEILKTLEPFDLWDNYPAYGGAFYDLFVGAAKLCWQERERWLGDPEFVKIPFDVLLSDASAAARADRIRRSETNGPATRPATLPAARHTVNIVAADAQGNVVSLTCTHGDGFGSHVAIPGTGLFLGHGMSRFAYTPGSPNAPQPGKRMQHNMCPLLIMRDDKPWAAAGLPGGTRIVTVTSQLAFSLIDYRRNPAEAVHAPRVHVDAAEPVLVGPTVPDEARQELAKHHRITAVKSVGGPANVVRLDGGTLTGACSAGMPGVKGI
jgi:gamma-glutamyltranspeptidase / glutathione hydrolase